MSEEVITDQVESVVEAAAEAVNGTAAKVPASPEGMMIAYSSLLIMALFPIFIGSYRSVSSHKESKDKSAKTGESPETMTQKDAMMFPVIASCALFGLYIFFQIFSKESINMLLTFYFFILGIFALSHMMSPVILRLIPAALPKIPFHLKFTQGEGESLEAVIDYEFNTHDLVCLALSSCVGVWYIMEKHWLANDLLGLAFAVNGVEMLHLNNVVTGCILLGGLFFYDIFWVFGTDVMVTVAKSFEAPIKLVFPQDLLENGLEAKNFAMLGLGDIVIPGIFIALLLRYDHSLGRQSHFYFYATFLAYIGGLATTIFVMHVYKHAQPALLYLVPACLGVPLFLGLVRGDIKTMFAYEDHPGINDAAPAAEEADKKSN